MNKEKKIQIQVIIKGLILILCSSLYAWSGIEMKWLRRYLAPAIASGTIYYYIRDWRVILQMGMWFGTLSMGYGANLFWEKVAKRALYGSLNGIVGSGMQIIRKEWKIVCFHLSLITSAYILFGVFNPFEHARTEEFFLGLIVFLPILYNEEKDK